MALLVVFEKTGKHWMPHSRGQFEVIFSALYELFRVRTASPVRYRQVIPVTGPNGRTIDVVFIFQRDGAGRVTFITGTPTK